MNNNPYKARVAARIAQQVRRSGDIEELRSVLWYAIGRVSQLLDSGDAATVLRATNSLAQVAPAYLKAIEVGEHAARISAIEQTLESEGLI